MSPDVTLVTNLRDWLSVEDGEGLRKLMPWLSKKMHERVHRAYWNHEYAMRSYYLDARWPLVVSGLEALISIGEDDPSWQFRDRARQLASEFKIDLTDYDLRVAYRLRSSSFTPRVSYPDWKPYYQRANTVPLMEIGITSQRNCETLPHGWSFR